MVLDYLVRQVSHGMYIELETPTFNTDAHRFCERNGFHKAEKVDYKSGSSFLYRMLV